MNKRNLISKAAVAAFVFAMAFNFAPFFGFCKIKAASHEITISDAGYYDEYHHGEHQLKGKAKLHKVDGQTAYCVYLKKYSAPGDVEETDIQNYLPGDELAMACLAQEYIFGMEGYSKEEKYMLTQCMVWYIQRDRTGDGGWRRYVSGIDMSVGEQEAFFADMEKKTKKEASAYEGHGTAWKNAGEGDMQEVAVLLAPTLKTGELLIKKVPDDSEIVKNNLCYSLEGAEYGVYTDEACTKQACTLSVDKDGNTESVTLSAGTYYVKEIKAPKGYGLDKEIYTVTVGFGEKQTLTVKETPQYVPLEVRIEKLDKESAAALPKGAASLEGAEFTVCYYDGFFTAKNLPDYRSYQSKAKRKWTIKTVKAERDGSIIYCADIKNNKCRAGGDDYYRYDGKEVLPIGTLSIEETKAPEGYRLEGGVLKSLKTGEIAEGKTYVTQITSSSEGGCALAGGNEYEASDKVVRGDLSLRKIDGENQKALAGVEFKLTSRTTGESHSFITDKNGEYDTSAAFIKHSKNTNAGKEGSGIWFKGVKGSAVVPVDNAEGALPFDTYELEEIKGKNNSGMAMFKDTVEISRDKTVVRLNNIENDGVSIHTAARDKESGTQYSVPEGTVTIIDSVFYNNLKKNQRYMLAGNIMDKDTGKQLIGKDQVPAASRKIFTANVKNGSTEIEFTFDASQLKDKDIVIFEELYEIKDDGTPGIFVTEHKDLASKEQSIFFREQEKRPDLEKPKEPEHTKEPEMGKETRASGMPVPVIQKNPESVKTGDDNSLIHLVILMILSCVSIFTCVRIARKD